MTRKADVAANKAINNARWLSDDVRNTFGQRTADVLPRLVSYHDVDTDALSKIHPYVITFSNDYVMCLEFKRNATVLDPPDRLHVNDMTIIKFR